MFYRKFWKNIRFRFLAIILAILLAGTLGLSSVIAVNERRLLQNNLLSNGHSLASFIARHIKDDLVQKETMQLDAIAHDALKEDIVYVVIRDEQGNFLTSQFASLNYQNPRFNAILLQLPRESELPDILQAVKKLEPVVEISVPVMVGTRPVGNVTIGVSAYRIHSQIENIILFVILLNAGVALVLGTALFVVSKKMILDPVALLTRATFALADGDLSTRVKVETTGEVKQLADRFNQMLEDLEKVTVSKDYMDAIIRSMIDTLIVVSPDNRVSMANSATQALLGYEEKELIGEPIEMILGDSMAKGGMLIRALNTKGFINNIVTEYRTKNGMKIPILFSGSILSVQNKKYGIVCVGKDITDRIRSDEEKQKLTSVLIQVQKMESIGQLAGGIAHDFNNILAAVMGYCHVMHLKLPLHDPVRKNVDQILAASEKAVSLIQGLLAFSRKQVISPKTIDLNDVIRGAATFLERIIGEHVELTVSPADGRLTIFADRTQMEQVFMNLATNARDAMPSGGRLILQTEQAVLNEQFVRTHGFGAPGDYALLTVSDTGSGIDEQTRKKIFEPFFTTKEVGKGTGLGLSTVYGIVKQNNGYITVYSEIGKGTSFKIYLPLVHPVACNIDVSEAGGLVRGGAETILIAEDNEAVRTLTHSMLSDNGYTVIDAADGEEAVNKFIENTDTIRLLICDVVMPRKNGKEVYDAVKLKKPDIKVIFTSGYPTDLVKKEGILETGLDFISKPSSPTDLLRKVREVLDA